MIFSKASCGSALFSHVHVVLDLSYLTVYNIIQIYSGITRGRVVNGDLYTQRLQKLSYLCLSTDHSSGSDE